MRCLLDINVLIAMMDPDHAFHHRAHEWWGERPRPWASCPLTENGFLRIMASSAYSKTVRFSVADIKDRLATFIGNSEHEFWPDSLSIRDSRHFLHEFIFSSRQLTDLYLLALAVENNGCLVSFDQHIPLGAVPLARPGHLRVI